MPTSASWRIAEGVVLTMAPHKINVIDVRG